MKLHVDPEADALYLRLSDAKIIESEEVSPGVVLDYDANEEVGGVEILFLSKRGVDTARLDFRTLGATKAEAIVREAPPNYGKAE
jgi:uncharacterized protein YuzE